MGKPELKVAFCNNGANFYLDKTDGRVKGAFSEIFNNMYPPYFNVTYVMTDSCIVGEPNGKGAFNGLIGYVQRKEADTMVMWSPIDLPGQPVKFTPVFGPEVGQILSKINHSESTANDIDLLESLKAFKADVWAMIFGTSLIFSVVYLSMKLFSEGRRGSQPFMTKFIQSFWDPFRVMIDQPEIAMASNKINVMFITLLMGYFFMNEFYQSSVTTTAVVTHKVDTIDSLQDLLDSNMRPIFVANSPATAPFEKAHLYKTAESQIFAKLWDKSTRMFNGKPNVVPLTSNGTAAMLSSKNDIVGGIVAFVSHSMYVEIMRSLICAFDVQDDVKFWVSEKRFGETLMAMPMSYNISYENEKLFDMSLYVAFESGLPKKWTADSPELAFGESLTINKVCLQRIDIKNKRDQTNAPQSLRLSHIKSFMSFMLKSIGVATVMLLIEVIVGLLWMRRELWAENKSTLTVTATKSPTYPMSNEPLDFSRPRAIAPPDRPIMLNKPSVNRWMQ